MECRGCVVGNCTLTNHYLLHRITLRQEALLELKYIERPDQLPDFALEL